MKLELSPARQLLVPLCGGCMSVFVGIYKRYISIWLLYVYRWVCIYGPLKLKGQFCLTPYWKINFGFGIFEYFSCVVTKFGTVENFPSKIHRQNYELGTLWTLVFQTCILYLSFSSMQIKVIFKASWYLILDHRYRITPLLH